MGHWLVDVFVTTDLGWDCPNFDPKFNKWEE